MVLLSNGCALKSIAARREIANSSGNGTTWIAALKRPSSSKIYWHFANTATPETPCFLIVGVEEVATGYRVVGVADEPRSERIAQILAEYTMPPVQVQYGRCKDDQGVVSVVTVRASDARPHWVSRDIGGVHRDTVYLRRDKIVGVASMSEIEAMMLQKQARLGLGRLIETALSDAPIQTGFVSLPRQSHWRATARITNGTAEPISGVSATFDVRLPAQPQVFYRRSVLVDATLAASESREIEIDLDKESIFIGTERASLRTRVDQGWVDLTLHVQYRDREGFIKAIESKAKVSG